MNDRNWPLVESRKLDPPLRRPSKGDPLAQRQIDSLLTIDGVECWNGCFEAARLFTRKALAENDVPSLLIHSGMRANKTTGLLRAFWNCVYAYGALAHAFNTASGYCETMAEVFEFIASMEPNEHRSAMYRELSRSKWMNVHLPSPEEHEAKMKEGRDMAELATACPAPREQDVRTKEGPGPSGFERKS